MLIAQWRNLGGLACLGLVTIACTALAGEPDVVRSAFDPASIAELSVDSPSVILNGPNAVFSLLVDGKTTAGSTVDLNRSVTFQTLTPAIIAVSNSGVIRGLADGAGTVQVEFGERKLSVPVQVSNSQSPRQFNFENDIVPILSKFGCNTSGCHGKAEGQNGFKLSVFGFDPDADFRALTQESRGRRVSPTLPEKSLLLTKASGKVPHGGGVRIRHESDEYRTLLEWITAGLPFGNPTDPQVVSVEVTPRERRMQLKTQQQLRVVATFGDGRTADVTSHARFQSNNETLAGVDESGLITVGEVPGEVAIMASYMGPVAIFRARIPRTGTIESYPQLAEQNFIDPLVYGKLRALNILPSEPCSDADYLRRVSLDITGTLPTADEARAFLQDSRPNRRALLVEELLKRPEFADYWALKWSDVLRVDREVLGHKQAYAYYRWIRDSFATNKPLDQFARELVTAEGPVNESPAANIYKVVKGPGALAGTFSQVFLGIRIECAQCHHHPFDRWSQTDYFGMQAFFTQVAFKGTGRGESLLASGNPATTHPRTGAVIQPHPLGTELPKAAAEGDRRKVLADWMTASDNPWFARNIVNRTWAHFVGRGIVHPVDDVRLTNPPTNPELLDALARRFIETKYDFQELIRNITASRVYQASSAPNATNERDDQNFSRALFKRLDAEVVLDAVCQTTGVEEKYQGFPSGYRAIQLWDSKVSHYFLKLFGRPSRVTPCECERTVEPTVAQVLHVMNSPELQGKLTHSAGRLARLVSENPNDESLVDELYLTFYSRFPTSEERQVSLAYLQSRAVQRRQAAEDIAWTMLNTPEFLFNH